MDSTQRPSGEDVARGFARRLGAKRALVVCGEVHGLLSCIAELATGEPLFVTPLAEDPVSCPDLKALGRAAREEGRALIVDNTLPSVAGCPAVRLGAHAALEPLGEGVVLVGLSGDAERALPGLASLMDGLPQLDGAALDELRAAMDVRETTWHEASDVAQVVATYLVCHPRVTEVRYPGLRTDASFEVAARTLVGGFGPFVSYRVQGEPHWRRLSCEPCDPRELIGALEAELRPAIRASS